MRPTLRRVKNKVKELAKIIGAPKELLPTYESSKDFAHPHIELDKAGLYNYVVIEREEELVRNVTSNIDDLFYWIFRDVTSTMARDYELKNRVEGQDFRRIMFSKQEQLLGTLDANWKEKQIEEHKKILRRTPFDDSAELRATYCRELTAKGLAETEILKLAYQKYPEK